MSEPISIVADATPPWPLSELIASTVPSPPIGQLLAVRTTAPLDRSDTSEDEVHYYNDRLYEWHEDTVGIRVNSLDPYSSIEIVHPWGTIAWAKVTVTK